MVRPVYDDTPWHDFSGSIGISSPDPRHSQDGTLGAMAVFRNRNEVYGASHHDRIMLDR